MSAQAGIWSREGKQANQEFLARMGQAIGECGPDGETSYYDGPIGMLYRPFHTTLESRVEQQPHMSVSGKVITWDGRLDNRDELILQVWNGLTEDRSDAAIVGAAFDRWGPDCFAKLTGDWAVAIWNPQEKELTLARDYIGIRCLFYYPRPKRIIWCSHLAPLLLCGDQFTLCDDYLAGFLALHPDAHLTPYREIHSVPPGQSVHFHSAEVTTRRYWTFNPRHTIRYKTDVEYEEHFRTIFRQAVRRRLRTDSPILAELSGGLDSSSIVCMADQIRASEGTEVPQVDTFSFCDRDEPEEEDFHYFTRVEEKRQRVGHHAELRCVGDTFSIDEWHFADKPGFGARQELKTAQSEVIKRGKYRVILSGFGGDEFLGQAFDFHVQLADSLLQLHIRTFLKDLMSWSLVTRRPGIQLLYHTFLLLLPSSIRARIVEKNLLEPWINKTFARNHKLAGRLLEATETSWLSLPRVRDSLHLHASLAGKMTELQPKDAEMRYPYLDQSLTEFLQAIPRDQLVRPGVRRSLMRRALADTLPPEVLTRKTKSSTGRCVAITLAKHWKMIERILEAPISSYLGYIDQNCFRQAVMATKDGKESRYVAQLLRGLSLELWLRGISQQGVIRISLSSSNTTSTDELRMEAMTDGPSGQTGLRTKQANCQFLRDHFC